MIRSRPPINDVGNGATGKVEHGRQKEAPIHNSELLCLLKKRILILNWVTGWVDLFQLLVVIFVFYLCQQVNVVYLLVT